MENLLNNPYLAGTAGLALINLILLIVLWRKFSAYQKAQKLLLDGEGDSAALQDIVLKQKKQVSAITKNLKDLSNLLEEIVDQSRLNIQKVGVVRYNPFSNTGGNMSFVVALLDGRDNGILISSLHSREGTRIYAKFVEDGNSEFNMTEEEKQAIEKAKYNN